LSQQEHRVKIQVVGVGGAAGRALNCMIERGMPGVEFVAVNTDLRSLASSRAETLVRLGPRLTYGLGSGGRPETGEQAALEAAEELGELLAGSDVVVVTAGMGGGTGTGAAHVIAGLALKAGALTLGVATKPFPFEGLRREQAADKGIQRLAEQVDALFVVPNHQLAADAPPDATLRELFAISDARLADVVQSLCQLFTEPALVAIDLEDLRAILRGSGKALLLDGVAGGDEPAVQAARSALSRASVATLAQAQRLIVSITGGPGLSMAAAQAAVEAVRAQANPQAPILFHVTLDDALRQAARVVVIAAGIEKKAAADEEPPSWEVTHPDLDFYELDLPTFMRRRTSGGSGDAIRIDPAWPPMDRPEPETEVTRRLYAVARIRGYGEDQSMVVRRTYGLDAGVVARMAADWAGAPFQVTIRQGEPVDFDVTVTAEGMEIRPSWVQSLRYRPGRAGAEGSSLRLLREKTREWVSFTLTPRQAGETTVRVDFYHQRHWLAQVALPVRAVLAPEPAPA
jgi:cell division protein FtsZ